MITLKPTEILVTGTHTFEDIYQECVNKNKSYCRKLGTNMYLISTDLLVGDGEIPTFLTGENIAIIVEGKLLQIRLHSVLRLGNIDQSTGSTYNGCYLSCPNILNAYGFGSNVLVNGSTKSGDIKFYNSTIVIYGFWGFFSGINQSCDIIDCLVDGYGRVEGSTSRVANVTIQKSNGRYGVLGSKGNLELYQNITSKKSLTYRGHKCSLYFNPEFSPGLRITGGVYDGYTTGLIYVEPKLRSQTVEDGTVSIIDADIRNGYGGYFSDSYCVVNILYTFNPIFYDADGDILGNVNVTIRDNNGLTVYTGVSDVFGVIKTELLTISYSKNSSTSYSYYDVTATKDDLIITRRFRSGESFIRTPFFLTADVNNNITDGCSCDNIQQQMDTLKMSLLDKIDSCAIAIDTKTNFLSTKLNTLESGVRQVISEVVDEVNENQSIVESTGWKVVI